MKNIRHKVFETNSSSTHSISISHKGNHDDVARLKPVDFFQDSKGNAHTNCLVLNGGEFGWEIEQYTDVWTKANYIAVALGNPEEHPDSPYRTMFERVLLEASGADYVVYNFSSQWDGPNYSYIDHQSNEVAFDALTDETTLKDFLFNRNSVLYTDNDNH